MPSVLTVITFLAGATWDPIVSTTTTKDPDACKKLSHVIAQQITTASASNVRGGASMFKDGETLTVVAAGAPGREMARLTCSPG